MTLNVLVVEDECGAADEAIRELTGAGHTVLRCHDPGAPAFPCRGLVEASTCPLRSHAIDVALAVRAEVSTRPAPSEDGARCALMSHVPLVVAGPSALDPYAGLETVVLNRTFDVVESCEQAAAAELVEHGRRAEAVVADYLPGGGECVPTVTVTRRAGGLRVHVVGLDGLTAHDRQAAVLRILAALRVFDRSARTVDVVVGEAQAGFGTSVSAGVGQVADRHAPLEGRATGFG